MLSDGWLMRGAAAVRLSVLLVIFFYGLTSTHLLFFVMS